MLGDGVCVYSGAALGMVWGLAAHSPQQVGGFVMSAFEVWAREFIRENSDDVTKCIRMAIWGTIQLAYPMLAKKSEARRIYELFENEIWGAVDEFAIDVGCSGAIEMVHRAYGRLEDADDFKRVMVWLAMEWVCRHVAKEAGLLQV